MIRTRPSRGKTGKAAGTAKEALYRAASSFAAFCRFWVSRSSRVWASLGILAFLISAVILFLSPDGRMRLYLEYPRMNGRGNLGEVRYVPRRWDPERKASLVLEEILLGPESLSSRDYLSRNAQISSIMVRKSVVYADLKGGFIHDPAPPSGSWEGDFKAMRRLMMINLPFIRRVVFTVDGKEPYENGLEETPGEAEAAEGGPAASL